MTLKQAIANTTDEIKSRNPKTYQELRNCVDPYICLTTDYAVKFINYPRTDGIVGVQLLIPGRKQVHILPSADSAYEVTKTDNK